MIAAATSFLVERFGATPAVATADILVSSVSQGVAMVMPESAEGVVLH